MFHIIFFLFYLQNGCYNFEFVELDIQELFFSVLI